MGFLNSPGVQSGAVSTQKAQNTAQQQALYNQYMSNLPTLTQDQNSMNMEGGANNLMAANRATTANKNQNGLLYSGLNEGAHASNDAATQAAINTANANSTSGLLSSAGGYGNAANSAGMQDSQNAFEQALNTYNAAAQAAASNVQMVGSAITGGSKVAGMAMAA